MGFFKKSIKGLIDIAVTPIEVIKDVATLGGGVTDKNGGTYTGDRVRKMCKNFSDAYDSLDD